MPFVVDNSAVVAWHFGGQATPCSDAVLSALVGEAGHVPALWSLEFSNVVRKSLIAKRITEQRAPEIMQIQASLALTIHDDIALPAENMALALRYQLSLDSAVDRLYPLATPYEY